MKIAVSSCGPTPDCTIDDRLGRAYWLLVYNLDEDSWLVLDNSENRAVLQGAGQRTAEVLIQLQVTHVLTGGVGPKAFRLLTGHGIRIYLGVSGSAAGALLAWQRGDFQPATEPNQSGSPYCLMGKVRRNLSETVSAKIEALPFGEQR
ncbi:hypothetical protein C2E25_12585 [Geothermobacter hydrogeniphilus]|uniref:Dinitrogenase iron-molybdenum cofactor biosynthesis domain-containing protein n=1 Tax=Geothermobacter hydrogeniphilus TaxID=1969733 RepID=A0A2K2H826_9BACT|nr:NifB/NifX family molybdenum-iron cluster-binding protein [Geothermobacter hydrogeniphilus]PNU19411.1 hypothetical protein C2E25_12585 [Geothermobacter hydrogeniphilus]